MADTPNKTGIVQGLKDFRVHAEDLAKRKRLLAELEKLHVDLDKINEDLPLLEKVSEKDAKKVKELLAAYFTLDEEGKYSENALRRFKEDLNVSEKRLDRWYSRWAVKGKNWFEEHVTELSAAALATNAFKKALDQTRMATDHLIQTTGRLDAGWTDTIKETYKVGQGIKEARMAAAGYMVATEEVEQSYRKYLDLFQTNEGVGPAFERLGALSRIWGKDFNELFEFVGKRQREFGKSAAESTEELGSIYSATQQLHKNLKGVMVHGRAAADVWDNDFAKVVMESAEELGGLGTNLTGLTKVQAKAFEYASKLGMSFKDSMDFAKGTAQLFKLPDLLQYKTGERIYSLFKEARDQGKGEEWLQTTFGAKAQEVKRFLEALESKDPQERAMSKDIFAALAQDAQTSEAGLQIILKQTHDFINKDLKGNTAATAAYIFKDVQDRSMAMNLALAVQKGEFQNALGLLNDQHKSAEERVKGIQDQNAKNKVDAEKALNVATKEAKDSVDNAKGTILGWLSNPLNSLVAAGGLLAAKAVYTSILNGRLLAQATNLVRATAQLAAGGLMRGGTGGVADALGGGGSLGGGFNPNAKYTFKEASAGAGLKGAGRNVLMRGPGAAAAGESIVPPPSALAKIAPKNAVTAAGAVKSGGFRGMFSAARSRLGGGTGKSALFLAIGAAALAATYYGVNKLRSDSKKKEEEEAKKQEAAGATPQEESVVGPLVAELGLATAMASAPALIRWVRGVKSAGGAKAALGMMAGEYQASNAAFKTASGLGGKWGVLKSAMKGGGGVAAGAGRGLLRRIPYLQIAMGGIEAYSAYSEGDMKGVSGAVGSTVGGIAGGAVGLWAGGAAGAAIGTAVCPVIGTIVGGLIGLGVGALGAWLGRKAGEWAYDSLSEADKKVKTGLDSGNEQIGMTLNALNAMRQATEDEVDYAFSTAARRGKALDEQIKTGKRKKSELRATAHSVDQASGDLILTIDNSAALFQMLRPVPAR